ncbi:MAG: hypothetical protein V3U11_01885 [Planctomycetota bacterium]
MGPNSGKQVVEITNTTNAAVTPKGWQICAPLTYAAIPQIQIPAGGVVQLHINTSGTNTATDFFFSVFRDLGFSDTFLIYKSNNFINSNDIIDFVSWGSGTARIAQAVSVGQWNANNAHVALPLGEGKTISYDGNGDASTDWVAAAPSLGKSNQVASFTAFGKGCAGRSGTLGLAATPRPRLGTTFTATVSNLPPLAATRTFMIFGASNTTWNGNKLPLDLGFLGAPGCNLNVSFDLLLSLGGGSQFKLAVPNDTRLLGVKFYMQAYTADSTANAAGLVVSNGVMGQAGN